MCCRIVLLSCLLAAPFACFGQKETIAKPQSAKEKKKQAAKLAKEMGSAFDKWATVDVAYIITDDERKAYNGLSNDDERESFIEQFWRRRDPTPDTQENEYKEEHYRRIAYANEHFASGIPGWKTDRGRIYIIHGPPDEIESHPTGGTYQRPIEQGGGQTTTYAFEQWRYRHLDQVGDDVIVEFVDPSNSGEYRLAFDPAEKDALQHVPGYQAQAAPTAIGQRPFDILERNANVFKPPSIKYSDLQSFVSTSVRYNAIPLKARTDYFALTPSTVLAGITLQFDRRDLQFREKDGVATATINLAARISTLSRRTVNVFEDVLSVDGVAGSAVYQKAVPLAPGRYRLNVIARDVVGGGVANYEASLDVPKFEGGILASSSLILADLMEPVPSNSIGAGQFVFGDMKVRPRVDAVFRTNEKLGIYMQVYNCDKASGRIEYEITRTGSKQPIVAHSEATEGITIKKWLSLRDLPAGSYNLRVQVTDKSGNRVSQSQGFTVN